MGALVVLTMGVFSSCKDYDDDINANTALIKTLQSQVDALESAKTTLTSDLSAANQAIAAAQADATKALNDLATAKADLTTAIADAKANLEASISAAQQAAIDEAQKRIDAATTDLKAAITAGDEAAVAEAQKRIDEATATLTATLNSTKADLENKITAAQQAAIDEAQSRIDKANAELKTYAQEVAVQEAAAAAAKVKIEIIDELNKKVAELNTAINAKLSKEEFETVLATLATKEGVNEALKPLMNDIAALQGKVTSLEGNVSTLNGDVATLKEQVKKIDELSAKLDELYADAVRKGELATALADLETKILANVGENYLTLVDFNEFKESEFAAVKASLEQAVAQVEINTAAISALDEQVDGLDESVQNILSTMVTKEFLAETLASYATAEDLAAAKVQIQEWVNGLGFQTEADVKALIAANNATIEALIAESNAALAAQIGVTIDEKIAANNTVINNTITEKYNSLLDLVNQCAKASDLNDLEGVVDNLTQTMGQINTSVNGLGTRVTTIETELGSLQAALNNIANNILVDFPELGANATSSANTLAAVLVTMANRINELGTYVSNSFAAVQAKIDNIKLFVTKNITSLVYRPEIGMIGDQSDAAYLYGFPVIRALLLQPQPVYSFTYKAATATAGDIDEVKTAGTASKQFDVVAKYWLNPSTADITKYNFDFDEVTGKNIITRGNEDKEKAGVHVAKVLGVDNKGILSVALKINNAENVNNALTKYEGRNTAYSWITTVALQAIRNDQDVASKDTVTSDYAIIVPSYLDQLILANNDFQVDHVEGNQKFHLRTVYDELKTENAGGTYSYELAYNNENDSVDLTQIVIHNGTPCDEIMSHKDAEDRGFKFKYTILTNKEYFTLNNESQKIGVAKKDNSAVGKVANVRVELQADGKTFAYGYISIIITNDKVNVNVEIPAIILQCPGDFKSSITWVAFTDSIKKKVGPSFSFDNYKEDMTAAIAKLGADLKPAKDPINASILQQSADGKNLVWTFTEATAKKLFYNADNTPKESTEYVVYATMTPKDGKPEVADVTIKFILKGVVYPRGTFKLINEGDGQSYRIHRYWFQKESTNHADNDTLRYEVHANVDVYGQTQTVNSSLQADDDFYFDATAFFLKNQFSFVPAAGFDWSATINNEAPMFFNSSRYDVRNGAADGTAIAAPKEVLTGASGAKYALYLENHFSLELMATKQNANGTFTYSADDQPVVTLSSITPAKGTLAIERNEIVKFEGKRVEDGTRDYARDLLNNDYHYNLAAGETFTTHMIFADPGTLSCLPIALDGYRTFDIRYLRPLSADVSQPKIIKDAVDGGTVKTRIYLTDLASFIDWRDYKFIASSTTMKYVYYYGVKKIKADFENAKTNLNGGANVAYNKDTHTTTAMTAADHAAASAWPLIKDVTSKLKFTPDAAAEKDASTVSRTNDFATFRDVNCGYYLYENNSGNVGTFQIYLPISIVYDWGETRPVYVLVTIEHTEGQVITARQK